MRRLEKRLLLLHASQPWGLGREKKKVEWEKKIMECRKRE